MPVFSRWLYGSVAFLIFSIPVYAQDTTVFNKTRKLVRAGECALYGTSLVALGTVWYKEPKTGFHLFDDAGEWLQMDKAGHLTTAYQVVRINNVFLTTAGFNDRYSMRFAMLSTLGYMTIIEVFDGFSKTYGASVTDLAANFAGAGMYYLQYKTATTGYFTLKYSYRQSGLAGFRPELLGKNFSERLLKDYNAQTYWLSLNIQEITGLKKIPGWLNLAVGYSADGMLGGKANPVFNEAGMPLPLMQRKREYALSFDIATDKLFKKRRALNKILTVFAFIKVPLPGVIFSKGNSPTWQLYGF